MPVLPPTTGAPLNLYVPPFNYGSNPATDFTWDVPANDNWAILNSFASTVVLYNPTASQIVAQPGVTYLNINAFLAYDGSVRFGTAANVWDSALSRSGAGAFTLDSNVIGNAAGSLKLNALNAVAGFQYNGAAPNNHILVGNGTHYVDSATLPAGIAFYQTVQAAGVSQPQELKLNFLARLTAVDNGGNGSTDVDLATTAVTPGSYTNANIAVDAYGRITSAANGSTVVTQTDVTGSRSLGTTFQNTTGKAILVYGFVITATGSQVGNISANNGPTSGLGNMIFSQEATATQTGGAIAFNFPVPAGWFYNLVAAGTAGITLSGGKWFESTLG